METTRAILSERDIQEAKAEKKNWLAVFSLRERPVFCNCLGCSKDPLFTRTTAINVKNARKHCRRDLNNCAANERDALERRQQYVTLENFLALYEGWLRGTHNEYGARLASEHTFEARGASQPSAQRSAGQPAAQPAHDPPEVAYADDSGEEDLADPPYPRPNAVFKEGYMVGRWAEYYDGPGDRRPTSEHLQARLPGTDGSVRTRAHWNDDTGEVEIEDDKAVPEATRIWLSKKVLQKQMDNWTQKSFNNVLRDWKTDPAVSANLKDSLQGIDSYEQVLKVLELQSDQVPYLYDICAEEDCAAVFRGEFADLDNCPRCRKPRYVEDTQKARKKLIYFGVADWLKGLFENEYLAREMREWHVKRKHHDESDSDAGLHPDETPMQDHFDGKLWGKFCQDPEVQANGGPSFNAALEFCADGVSPYRKIQHSMWFAAMSALNLPPFLRHTLETMHLCFIIPGPKEPVDLQPYLDIVTDELEWLYYEGASVSDGTGNQTSLKAMLLRVVSDYRGFPKLFRLAQAPALRGACYVCKQKGVKLGSSTLQPGLVEDDCFSATSSGDNDEPNRVETGGPQEPAGATPRGPARARGGGVAGRGARRARAGAIARGRGPGRGRGRIGRGGKVVYAGYGRWLPTDGSATNLRKASTALNANAHAWAAEAPFMKTTEWYRKHAKRGDRALLNGIPVTRATHPCKKSGVQSSHCWWKLPYWDETSMRGPDSMHTVAGEAKAIFQMLAGTAFRGKQGETNFNIEQCLNSRWRGGFPKPADAAEQGQASGSSSAAQAQLPGSGQLPFVLTGEQQAVVEARLASMKADGHTPQAWSSTSIGQCFSQPSALKMHDWLILAGPIGKYALQGMMGGQQRANVFAFFDLLSAAWCRRISVKEAQSLTSQAYRIMAELEVHLPAWELDITRHMLLHMIEQIPSSGPLWAWSMWAYERLWGRLLQWKTQKTYPEATIANQFKAFKVAMTSLSRFAARGAIGDDLLEYCRTFERDTNSILLPDYLEEAGMRSVHLFDQKPEQRVIPTSHVADKYWLHLQLHKYYLNFYENYKGLWARYLADKGTSVDAVSKSAVSMKALLEKWPAWSLELGCSEEEQKLARGPHGWIRPLDRAKINGIPFTVSRLQRSTVAKNDIVAIVTPNRGVQVGKVTAFLQHVPVGMSPAIPAEEMEKLAQVEWFAAAPEGQAFSTDRELPGPYVAMRTADDPTGNLWQCEGLLPINIGLSPKVNRDGSVSETVFQVLQRDVLAFSRKH